MNTSNTYDIPFSYISAYIQKPDPEDLLNDRDPLPTPEYFGKKLSF